MIDINNYVLVLPEQITTGPALEAGVYGTVSAIEGDVATIKTLPNSFDEAIYTLAVSLDDEPGVVTEQEAVSAIGAWLRRCAVGRFARTWVHGQVVDYDFASGRVTLAAGCGRVEVPVDTLEHIFPVVAALLWNCNWLAALRDGQENEPAGALSRAEVLATHSMVAERVLGSEDGSSQPSRVVADILKDINDADAATDRRCQFTEPSTGLPTAPTVQHVVDYAFYVDANQAMPDDYPLGESFCLDPSDPGLETSSRKNNDQEQQETVAKDANAFQRLQDKQPPKAIARFLAPKSKVPIGSAAAAEHTQTQPTLCVDPCSTLALAPAYRHFPSDYELAHHGYGAITKAAAEQAEVFRLTARARTRANPFTSGDDLVEAFRALKKGNNSVVLSDTQLQVHWWATADKHHGLLPMDFLSRVMSATALPFIQHPGTFLHLYDWRFGPGKLSIAHFTPVTDAAQRAWCSANPISSTSFPANLMPPAAIKVLTSKQHLRSALGGLQSYTSKFNSAVVCDYVNSAVAFMEAVLLMEDLLDSDTPTIQTWLDTRFRDFSSAMTQDVSTWNPELPHMRERLKLVPEGMTFQALINSVQLARTAPAMKQPTSNNYGSSETRSGVPPDVEAATPRSGGLPVCLRYLSKKGCPRSVYKHACGHGDFRRRHVEVSRLDPVVEAFIVKMWGGLGKPVK